MVPIKVNHCSILKRCRRLDINSSRYISRISCQAQLPIHLRVRLLVKWSPEGSGICFTNYNLTKPWPCLSPKCVAVPCLDQYLWQSQKMSILEVVTCAGMSWFKLMKGILGVPVFRWLHYVKYLLPMFKCPPPLSSFNSILFVGLLLKFAMLNGVVGTIDRFCLFYFFFKQDPCPMAAMKKLLLRKWCRRTRWMDSSRRDSNFALFEAFCCSSGQSIRWRVSLRSKTRGHDTVVKFQRKPQIPGYAWQNRLLVLGVEKLSLWLGSPV